MNGKQHFKVGIGAGIGTAICLVTMEPYGFEPTVGAALGGITAAFASKLPDIDHNSTKVGRVRKKVTGTSNFVVTAGLGALTIFPIILAILGRTNVFGFELGMELLLKMSGASIVILVVKSAISKNKTFKWMTAHRGFMHTLILPIAFGVAAWIIPSVMIQRMLIGLTVGYVCHLDADMYTVDGCPLMFPISRHSFKRPGARKSADPALNRIATTAAIRYIITGIVLAILL